MSLVVSFTDAPCDLQCGITAYFPSEEWENAANIAWLESNWNRWALADTTDDRHPCGSILRTVAGVVIRAERSYSYFQINACNFPAWPPERLWNADHNAGTAHLIWTEQGWAAWYYSAKSLGLV